MAELVSPARLRLWQLISPALPIGAFAYSAGLEYAVEQGWVTDERHTADWLQGQLRHGLATLDVPVLARLHRAWTAADLEAVLAWNARLLAGRETAELRAEDEHLGRALARVLLELGLEQAATFDGGRRPAAQATLFALALWRWEIPLAEGAAGYLWAWVENQVQAAIKLVPLGQRSGQRLLAELAEDVPEALVRGLELPAAAIGASLPGVTLASMRHETQYSRLFRS